MAADRTLETLNAGSLESRLRNLAEVVAGDAGFDDLEMRHLLEILTKSSLLLRDAFDPQTLDRLCGGQQRPASLFGPGYRGGSEL